MNLPSLLTVKIAAPGCRVRDLEARLRDGRVTGPVCEDVPGPRSAGSTLREKSQVMAEILG